MESFRISEHNNDRIYGLDVARFLAISMVLVIHSVHIVFKLSLPFFWYLATGGVELFFSLSGFLIGRILLRNFANKEVTFRLISRFWIRRWLRTLPLYFIIYFIYLILYNSFIYPVTIDIHYLFFIHSFRRSPDFFGESWSLCTEEWFYLIVPLLIFAVFQLYTLAAKKIEGAKSLLITSILLILVMIIFRQTIAPKGTYLHGTLFRIDAISYGLIAAYISTTIKRINNRTSFFIIICGLVIWLLAAVVLMKPGIGDYFKSIYYPLCGTGTAILVFGLYYYQFQKKFSFIIFISKISYSIYLIHLTGVLAPLGMITTRTNPVLLPFILLASIGIIIILSHLSFKYIEQPFLRLRNKIPS